MKLINSSNWNIWNALAIVSYADEMRRPNGSLRWSNDAAFRCIQFVCLLVCCCCFSFNSTCCCCCLVLILVGQCVLIENDRIIKSINKCSLLLFNSYGNAQWCMGSKENAVIMLIINVILNLMGVYKYEIYVIWLLASIKSHIQDPVFNSMFHIKMAIHYVIITSFSVYVCSFYALQYQTL